MKQKQFLEVIDDDAARRRFADATVSLAPRGERVALDEAWGRVLFEDVRSLIDVPGFDRANMDGFAVRAADTFGATELEPAILTTSDVELTAGGDMPDDFEVAPKTAVAIATGARIPRGADAVLMVEDTALRAGGDLDVFRAVAPGANLSGAGSDLARGDVVLRGGTELGSRETGLLAAIGAAEVEVFRRPVVAVLSTGEEVKSPGEALRVGDVYDSNSRIVADAVRELGGLPLEPGIVGDDEERLAEAVRPLIADDAVDVVILSGGTSKGGGDLNHRVIDRLTEEYPGSAGRVVHGVAVKPGKPLCLATIAGKPVVVLPGFPTSAIFTFREFVAPLIRRLAGTDSATSREEAEFAAFAPVKIRSAVGRAEYVLVDLVPGNGGVAAYPMGAGSGSVSTFSHADGFIRIDRHHELVEEGAAVTVQPLGGAVRVRDLVVIGSHCTGLESLLGAVARRGFSTKSIHVGSRGGLRALARGEGDVAGTHLLDPETGVYNQSFLPEGVAVLGGYRRRQGIVFREGDRRFEGIAIEDLATLARTEGVRMINRNPGSGTRVLIDRLLGPSDGAFPDGYHAQARSHHAVAAAVAQGRADWGMTLEGLAREQGLGFVFVQDELFELAVRAACRERPAVSALAEILESVEGRDLLAQHGFGV